MATDFIHVITLPVNGGIALIDAADYQTICGYEWYIRDGYVVAKRDGQHVPMHRLILGLPQSRTPSVDHINGIRFDNRRCNLRACAHAENLRNRKKQKNTTSVYKGVHLTVELQWQAAITFEGKKRYLGRFATEEDAAAAYDQAACELFGEFAKLNFPHLRATYEQTIVERKNNPVPRVDRRNHRKRVYRPPSTPAPQPLCTA